MKVYKIDSWDNESFFVYADGVQVAKQTFGLNTPASGAIIAT